VRYAWIEAHIDAYPTTLMCELLSVSRSGLCDARRREPSARVREEAQIVTQIRRAQVKHRGRYGRRRMTTEMCAALERPINEVAPFVWTRSRGP